MLDLYHAYGVKKFLKKNKLEKNIEINNDKTIKTFSLEIKSECQNKNKKVSGDFMKEFPIEVVHNF